ncbi:MAG: hypothetical protein KDA72_20140, partial [Planctomycetales bacterium]|nr:hypothetical protein [Planctomycetales bacterium]
MALPPWTRELTRDLMSGSFDEAANRLKSVVSTSELPAVAMRGLDRVIRETRKGADQVRRWTQRFSSLSYGTINGTGLFFHPELKGCPLDAEQLYALLAGEDLFAGHSAAQRERIERQLEATLTSKVGTSAIVAHSMEAAIVAVSASLAPSHTLVIPRCFTYRPDHGKPLPDLLRAAGGRVEEVGTAEGCRREDWPTAAAENGPAWAMFQVLWPEGSKRMSAANVQYPETSNSAKHIALVPYGRLQTGTAALDGLGSLLDAELISQHWLTIVPGDLLLGAPRSALILGSASALASVASSPLWSVTKAELGTVAAVTATLRQPTDTEHALARLARVGEENLQNRAER